MRDRGEGEGLVNGYPGNEIGNQERDVRVD